MTANSRLGICQVCGENSSKYRCPKCHTVTCCLDCSKRHKKLNNYCDGIRDKTKYIPLDNFTNLDLLSDFSLLDSASKCIDSKSRNLTKENLKRRNPSRQLPEAKFQLKKACMSRGNCRLNFLPENFDRHKKNSTKYNPRRNEIHWRVEFVFPHADNRVVVKPSVSERVGLGQLIRPLIEEIDSNCDGIPVYQSLRLADTLVLLKIEMLSEGSSRFIEMDPRRSLAWNFQGAVLLEHPVIYVIAKSHAHTFLEMEHSEAEEGMKEEETTEVTDGSSEAVHDPRYEYYLKYYIEKLNGEKFGSVGPVNPAEAKADPVAADAGQAAAKTDSSFAVHCHNPLKDDPMSGAGGQLGVKTDTIRSAGSASKGESEHKFSGLVAYEHSSEEDT